MDNGTFLPSATQVFRRKRVHMAGDPRDLIAHLRGLDGQKKDFIAPDPLAKFCVSAPNDAGRVEPLLHLADIVTPGEDGRNSWSFPIMEQAVAQLAERYRVGTVYSRRMAETAPDLFATNFNYWLERSDKKTLWRTFAGKVRAVLSQRFRIFDNSDIALRSLRAALEHSRRYNTNRGFFNPDTGEPVNTVELFGWQADMDSLHMWLVDTTVTARLPTMDLDPKVAQYVNGSLRGTIMDPAYEQRGTVERMAIAEGRDPGQGGTLVFPIVEISNNEAGEGKLKVIPGCGISVCSNLVKVGVDFARIHLGQDISKNAEAILTHETRRKINEAIYAQVEDGVRACFDPKLFAENVGRLRTMMEIDLRDKVEAIDLVVKSEQMGDEERDAILAAFAPKVHPEKVTVYDIAMAVTQAAQDFEGVRLIKMQDVVAPWAESEDKARRFFNKVVKD